MRKVVLSLSVFGTMLVPLLAAAPAHAQATRTWVSGVGDDVNPCSRTAPCKTFAGAISKTALNGEINCLDPGGFGTVTITKSITIDCHEVFGSSLNASINGVNIPFDNFVTAGETRKTVRLRNINFNGFDTGTNGIRITGAAASANSEVFIEDCLIDGDYAGTARGITDERSGGGKLFVTNTTIRNVGGSGVVVLPASGSTRIDVLLNNVRVYNATSAGAAINNGAKAMIWNSVFSGNGGNGIDVEGAGAEANVSQTVTSNNGQNGVFTLNGGVVRLSNTNIAFNTTGIAGATQSFVTNRIAGNGTPGVAPTAIPPTPSIPTGQQ
jgi:hypothetical protein